VACSLLFAADVLPGFSDPRLANAAAAVALMIALLVPSMADVSKGGLSALLRARHIPALGLIYWILLDMVQQLYELPVRQETALLGYAAVGVFAIGSLLGGSGRRSSLPPWLSPVNRVYLSGGRIFIGCVFCFLCSVGYYLFRSDWSVPALLEGMVVGRGASPWARGAYGDSWAAVEFIAYFGHLLPSLFVLLIRSSRHKISPQIVVAAGLTVFVCALIVTDGGRRAIGAVVLSAILCWLVTGRSKRIRRRLSLAQVIVGVVCTSALAFGLNVVLQTRSNWSAGVSVNKDIFSALRVDDNFLRLCQTIDAVPAYAPYAGLQPVIFAAVRPIPRALWPGKPTDPGFTVHGFLNIQTVSLSSSIVGELYSCYGFGAVLLGGLAYGWLCGYWTRLLNEASSLSTQALYCVGYSTLFVGMRSMADLFVFAYPTIAALLLFRMMKVLTPAAQFRPHLHLHAPAAESRVQ
jgi:hypothetical protein